MGTSPALAVHASNSECFHIVMSKWLMRRWYTRGRETGLGDRYSAEEEESGFAEGAKRDK